MSGESLHERTRAILLGGGPGWDESGFAAIRPYPLMPVAHTPLICHMLRWLALGGVRNATICTNETWRLSRSLLNSTAGPNMRVSYYVDIAPRGAAGCVRDAAAQFGGQRFIVCDGTILPDCDLDALLQHHLASRADMTVAVTRERLPQDGLAQRLSPCGIYVLEQSVLAEIPPRGFQDLKEMLLPRLYGRGANVSTFLLRRPCPRVVGLNSYLSVCATTSIQLASASASWPGYRRVGSAFVHESAVVEAPDRLIGPVLVGAETHIAADASVVGPTTIGAQCRVQRAAVVCASVLWDDCEVGPRAVVDHAVLADGARVPSGRRVDHAVLPGTSGWPGGGERLDEDRILRAAER
jgi:NDP-sugar pyrophosphorylase family protein